MDTIIDINQSGPESSPWKEVARSSWRALIEPARFFRTDFSAMDPSSAITFGIANGWAASAVAFFMRTINSLLLAQVLDRWMQRLLSSEEGFQVWGLSANSFLLTSGALLLGPFFFLFETVICSSVLYVFARLLIEDRPGALEPVTYKGSLKIQAISLVSNWYSVVPIFGGLLSFYVSLMLTVIGVRERFGVSTRRAAAVVLAPYVLLAFFAVLVGAFLLIAITQLPLTELLDIDPKQLGL